MRDWPGDHARRRLGDAGLETAAREQAVVGAVLADEDPGALAAIGAAPDPDDRRERRLPARQARVPDGRDDALGLAAAHS